MARRTIQANRRSLSQRLREGDGGLFLFGGVGFVNLAGFLFHVVVSRRISEADYGALGALLGVILVLGVPAGAIQVAITREVASRRSGDGPPAHPVHVGPLLATAVLYGAIGCLALGLAAPLVASALKLPPTAALLTAAYVVPAAISVVPRGVLLGERRFRPVTVALVAGASARVLLSLVFGARSGLNGALAATVLGEVVTGALLLFAMRSLLSETHEGRALSVHARDAVAGISALAGFWTLTSVDTIVARRLLSPEESGVYAAAAVASRAAMFLPAAVALLALPRFAEAKPGSVRARVTLFRAMGAVGLIGSGVCVLALTVPHLIIQLLFGDRYLGAVTPLRILVVVSAAMGLVNVMMNFHLAQRRPWIAQAPWVGVALVVVLATFDRSTTTGALAVMMSASVIFVALLMFVAVLRPPRPEPGPRTGMAVASAPATTDVTIVIPYYNPGPKFADNVRAVEEVLRSSGMSYEIIAVSDGSTDGSQAALLGSEGEALRLLFLERNSGKGEALRTGLSVGTGRYVGFIDADGDIDPGALIPFLKLAEMYSPDIVLGSKRHPLSNVSYPPLRRLYSWGYQQLVRLLFRLNVRDSQTGLKLVRREVLAATLPRMVEKRFAFDLEMFVVARHLGYTRFMEAPVVIRHQFTSTISSRAVGGMLRDTLAILYRLRLLKAYERPIGPDHDEVAITHAAVSPDTPLVEPSASNSSPSGAG